MAFFMELTKRACRLYRASFTRVLPFSIPFAVLIHFVQDGHHYVPLAWQKQYQGLSMFFAVLSLPLLAGVIIRIDEVAKRKTVSLSDTLSLLFNRFITLIAVLVSMILLPAIVFLIGFIIEFVLLGMKAPLLVINLWRIFLCFALFASITPKLFSIFLVFTEDLDANSALEKSDKLTKGVFFQTFLIGLQGVLFLILIFSFASLSVWLVPALKAVPRILLDVIGQAIVAFTLAWSFALWMTQMADRESKVKSA